MAWAPCFLGAKPGKRKVVFGSSGTAAGVVAVLVGCSNSTVLIWNVGFFSFFPLSLNGLTWSPSFIIDTWQYFWHRALHINKTLYKRFHAVHHRLYVPYAYGALYNHPVEGFVLDSLGAALAEALTGMTIRQAALLFVLSTLKTVDDHCGYALPWDPLQMLFGNNADYHDIHHQVRLALCAMSQLTHCRLLESSLISVSLISSTGMRCWAHV